MARPERKEDVEATGWLERGGDVKEGLMGNEMMRESDEVEATEESSDDFNTVKDNSSLLILLFAVGFLNPVKNWPDTRCHLQESVNSADSKISIQIYTTYRKRNIGP